MTPIKCTLLSLMITGAPLPGFSQVILNDGALTAMARKENPATQQIDSQIQKAKFDQSLAKSQFDPKLAASYSYASSKEDAIIPFIPIWMPEKALQVGVEQRLAYGLKLNTGIFANQLSSVDGSIANATQVGAQVRMELDIWKNFLGRLDRKDLNNQKLSENVARLQGRTEKNNFVLDIRKIYWSLVASELSLKLSERLVKTATKQLKEARKQARDGAGDASDVSRNQAQVLARESSVLFFSYQKERLMAQLKSFLPGLEGETLSLNTAEQFPMETKTRQCLAQIAQQKTMNGKFSDYPEIVNLLDQQNRNAVDIAKATDSMDLKLQARYQASGVSQSHGQAIDRFSDEFKNGYQVGVALKVPLGGDIRKARESRVLATQFQITSQKEGLRLMLVAEHEKAQRALSLLGRASVSQSEMIKNLNVSLKQSQKKYRQARIPLNTLVLEQDNYFNAELQHIETKRQILEFLFDYFKVFPKHPCPANMSKGGLS